MRLTLLLFLLLPAFAASADDLAQRRAELAELKARIAMIVATLEQDRRQEKSLASEIETIEKRLSSLHQAQKTLQRDLITATRRSEALDKERRMLEDDLKHHYRALSAQIRAAFVLGRQSSARMLLSQDDPNRLARLQAYVQRFEAQHRRDIVNFETTLQALQDKRSEADKALVELKTMQQAREQTLAGIVAQRRSRQSLLGEVKQRLGQGSASLASLQQQEQHLESLIESLGRSLNQRRKALPRGRFADNRGKLVRPVDGPYLARYYKFKADGETRWKGDWLAAEAGEPVRATADGQVVYVGWMLHYGLLIVLDHGDGYFSLYGHNRAALRSVGDSVAAGDTIAEAGDTGGHDKTGVYFEIRKGRSPQNPSQWLSPRKTG